jgi:DNA-binding IclR family transcriptional regulator
MTEPADGRAVVAKVGRLLRTLGSHGTYGATTSMVAVAADVTRPTTHRLLSSLMDEGLVDRDQASGRWHLGPELYLLGELAGARYDLENHARDILRHLAIETGESAYLSAARGQETVCILTEEGSFPLRSHVLHEGIRFPLGVASAGLAILAHLPEARAEHYIATNDLTGKWGRAHSRRALRERVATTRQIGFAINPGLILEGSWGLGAAVFDRTDEPAWALSLTGVESRFRPERTRRLGPLLLTQAHLLTRRLRDDQSSSYGI